MLSASYSHNNSVPVRLMYRLVIACVFVHYVPFSVPVFCAHTWYYILFYLCPVHWERR